MRWLLLLTAASLFAQAPAFTTHTRTHGKYTILYLVANKAAMTLPNANDQPHYPARITVKEGAEIVAHDFSGWWTPGGCFEDDPKLIVDRVKQYRKAMRRAEKSRPPAAPVAPVAAPPVKAP